MTIEFNNGGGIQPVEPSGGGGGGSANIQSLDVTPSTTSQKITASSGVDGYSPVNVSAVTSSIDNNITAGNIKNGVTILGVTGSVTELKGETRTVSLTSSSGNTFTPSNGKNGITSIKVNPNNQNRTVTPSKSKQTIGVGSGYSGNGTITVNAVTSSIDSNITAGNIKNGVTILGVTGNYSGSGGGSEPNLYFDLNGTVSQGKISQYSGNPTLKLGSSVTDIANHEEGYGLLMPPPELLSYASCCLDIDFSSLTQISGNYGLSYSFAYLGVAIGSVDFSNLQSISGRGAFQHTFDSTAIADSGGVLWTFPALSSITGTAAFEETFQGTYHVELYFPALTTVSAPVYEDEFYKSVFYNIFMGVEEGILHFPADLESTITAWDDYENNFGGEGYVSVVFDAV